MIEQGDLLENSIQAGLDLGQALSAESAERSRAERELLALRGLSEALRKVGASFDRAEIVGQIDTGLAKPQRSLAGVAEFPG